MVHGERLPAVDPVNQIALRAWNWLDGEINSPLLPLLCVDFGIEDVTDFVRRLVVIRDYHRKENNARSIAGN